MYLFFTDSTIRKYECQFDHDIDSFIQLSNRLTKENFTGRIYKSSDYDGLSGVHWWIGEGIT